MKRIGLFQVILVILLLSACNPALPAPAATEPQAAPTTESEPLTQLSTATSEAPVPAGWATYTNQQQCKYTISYPADMQPTEQTPYSQTFLFTQDNPDAGARNFIYVSVIAPEIQEKVKAGTYDYEVYNYDPAATDLLLNMQIGESKAVHPSQSVASGFTYQRQPDTIIGSHSAQTYENTQPWEFPAGTREIRYYLALNGCTFLVGGYMDTTGSRLPGNITEDLFHQVIGTLQLMP